MKFAVVAPVAAGVTADSRLGDLRGADSGIPAAAIDTGELQLLMAKTREDPGG